MSVVVRYYLDWIVQLTACLPYYIMFFTPTLLFTGTSLYIAERVDDFRAVITELNGAESCSSKLSKCWGPPRYLLFAIFYLYPFLHFPSVAEALGKLMSATLFYQLFACVVSLAVYMVGIETYRLFSIGFAIMITGISNTTASTYIYCLFAENVTRKLSATGDIFYEYLWYQLPVGRQQPFTMAIQRAHMKFHFTGFGLVNCSLEVFATVMIRLVIIFSSV